MHGSCFIHQKNGASEATVKVSELNAEILAHFGGKKNYVEDFQIKDVINRTDGNILVIMEQKKQTRDVIAGSSPTQYQYKWNYGSCMVLCLQPGTGELQWWQKFDKKQESINNSSIDYFGSFVFFEKNNQLFILWNNTELSIASIPPANWTEPDGTKYVKFKAFDEKTKHATFLHIIEPDGTLTYSNRKYGLPLFNLHQGAVFEMSLTTPFVFNYNGNPIVMAMMHNGGKRYRFGFISFWEVL